MKCLVLILSCQAHRETRQAAVLETWARRVPDGLRLWLVEGGHQHEARERVADGVERLLLEEPDTYDELARKTYTAIRRALAASWSGLLKVDDDTFVHLPRLLKRVGNFPDYAGHPARGQNQFTPYACGGAYWLSRRAAEALVERPFYQFSDRPWYPGNARMRKRGEKDYREKISIEDVMTGDILGRAGISLTATSAFSDDPFPSVFEGGGLITNHYLSPAMMRRVMEEPELMKKPFGRWRVRFRRWWHRDRKPE